MTTKKAKSAPISPEHREMIAALLLPAQADRQGLPWSSDQAMERAFGLADRLIAYGRGDRQPDIRR